MFHKSTAASDRTPMLLCTLAWEKGLLICGPAAGAAAGRRGSGIVADVCWSMTALQSSPSTAAIRFSLRHGKRSRSGCEDSCPRLAKVCYRCGAK